MLRYLRVCVFVLGWMRGGCFISACTLYFLAFLMHVYLALSRLRDGGLVVVESNWAF